MTLFRQFFTAQMKGLLIWMGVGALLSLAYTRSAATFVDNNSLAAMPPSLLALYGDLSGMNPVDMYLTISMGKGTILIPTLYAVILALSIVTREVDRRTMEFLLALPVQRTQVLAARLAVFVTNLTLVTVPIWAVFRYDLQAQGYQGSWDHLAMLFLNLWMLAIALGLVTLAASMWVDDYSVGVKIFLGITTLAFFLEFVLRGATVSRAGRLISPFSYVDLSEVMRSGSIGAVNGFVLMAVMAVSLAASFWAFHRKQFSA